MDKVNTELRKLMESYIDNQEKLWEEIEEAKQNKDLDAEIICQAMYQQLRYDIAKLFQTMKLLDLLDEEELAIGSVKLIK